MADIKFGIDIAANTNKAVKGLEKLGKKSKGLGALLKTDLAAGIATVTAAITAGLVVISKWARAAGEQQQAVQKLTQAMVNNGTFTADLQKRYEKFAASMQKVSKFGDELVLGAMTALTQQAGLQGEELEKATQATLDLAAATGMDLNAAAQLVGKSLGSSTNALARYGIETEGAVGSTERLTMLVDNVSKKFGGSAQAEVEGYSGKMVQFENAVGDLTEALGNAFLPALEAILPVLTKIVEQTTTFVDLTVGAGGKILAILGGYKEEYDLLKEAVVAQTEAEARLNEARLQHAEEEKARVEERKAADQERKAQLAEDLEIEKAMNEARKEGMEALTQFQNEQLSRRRVNEAQYIQQSISAHKERAQAIGKFSSDITTVIAKSTQDQGRSIADFLRQTLFQQVDAWAQAEIAKALMQAPLSFGATLGAIGPIVAAQTAAKAAIGGLLGFQQGGIVPGSNDRGDKEIVRVNSGEMILNKSQQRRLLELADGGGSSQNITLQVDGQILAEVVTNKQQEANERGFF